MARVGIITSDIGDELELLEDGELVDVDDDRKSCQTKLPRAVKLVGLVQLSIRFPCP